MMHDEAEQPFATLMDQVGTELAHWRRHEREHGQLPGGGLEAVWPQVVAVYGIPLRFPGIDEAQALALSRAQQPCPLSEPVHRQLFSLAWARSQQLRTPPRAHAN